MYRTIKGYDKIEQAPPVHRIASGETAFHRNYGLRICLSIRGGKSPPAPKMTPRYFEFYCISHMFDGRGFHWDKERGENAVLPGSMLCTTPGHLHFYGGDDDFYTEDSLCFHGPVADMLCRSGVFRRGIFKFGSERALLPIIELAADPRDESQLQANIALQKFICDLHLGSIGEGDKKRQDFDLLIGQIKKFPRKWWSVKEMSEFCGMSEVNFRRLFKRRFGISPKDYITRSKIAIASEKLCSTDAPVAKIAGELGFYDPFHFSRRFRISTGMPPSEFRKATRMK